MEDWKITTLFALSNYKTHNMKRHRTIVELIKNLKKGQSIEITYEKYSSQLSRGDFGVYAEVNIIGETEIGIRTQLSSYADEYSRVDFKLSEATPKQLLFLNDKLRDMYKRAENHPIAKDYGLYEFFYDINTKEHGPVTY